jgi:hypothetical protein
MGSAQGLLNCLVYGLSPGVRSNLVELIQRTLARLGLASTEGINRAEARHVELRLVSPFYTMGSGG